MRLRLLALLVIALAAGMHAGFEARTEAFSFAIIGDRTGFTQTGVYQHVWKDIDRFKPRFAINAGDTIQGVDDATAEEQWSEISPLFRHAFPLYLVPGNHDIWSAESERIWRRVTKHPPYYGVDYEGLHITVLDNSRTDALSDQQMQFLETDLATHASAAPKLIFFHRPFWLTPVLFQNPDFALHKLAKKYGVAAVVSGHVHRLGRWKLDGVEYLMIGSSGGQLRGGRFAEGWFFHWIEAQVQGGEVKFVVHELGPPDGEGRTFPASEWTVVR